MSSLFIHNIPSGPVSSTSITVNLWSIQDIFAFHINSKKQILFQMMLFSQLINVTTHETLHDSVQ